MDSIYVDSGVLIIACRAAPSPERDKMRAALTKDARYLYSSMCELESIPQTVINKRCEQTAWLKVFFENASRVICDENIYISAIREAIENPGLKGIDAIHVACALSAMATEIITYESNKNTLLRYSKIPVTSVA